MTTNAERFRATMGGDPTGVASACGRVNLIGEHTDYNEGFVLPMTIDRSVRVLFAPSDDDKLDVYSELTGERHSASIAALKPPSPDKSWFVYVAGAAWSFRDAGFGAAGMRAYIESDVPAGAGLSSSAALEVAFLRALCAVNSVEWQPSVMAEIAQCGENDFVGVRCGIMDQLTACCGVPDNALLIDCRSFEIQPVPIPAAAAFVVMDTGLKRALGDSEYNARRAACEGAVSALQMRDRDVRSLRDATRLLLDVAKRDMDEVTYKRALHVVDENQRPLAMAAALREGDLSRCGKLMNESHASLRDLYEVSSMHLDIICDVAREHSACFGARLTGAGFGGCALALVDRQRVAEFIAWTQPQYEARTYKKGNFFEVRASGGATLQLF